MKYLADVTSLQLFSERCTGCGRCLEVCPRAVLERTDRIVHIVDRDRCIECGACMMNCAFAAIRVNAGVGCASALMHAMLRSGEPECGCGERSSGCC